jgi:hypothetical protein
MAVFRNDIEIRQSANPLDHVKDILNAMARFDERLNVLRFHILGPPEFFIFGKNNHFEHLVYHGRALFSNQAFKIRIHPYHVRIEDFHFQQRIRHQFPPGELGNLHRPKKISHPRIPIRDIVQYLCQDECGPDF